MAQKKTLEVGIKELKNKTTQIMREIREKGTEYIVTLDGLPVAKITSLHSINPQERRTRRLEVLQSIRALAHDISDQWDGNMSAAEAVAEQRRGH